MKTRTTSDMMNRVMVSGFVLLFALMPAGCALTPLELTAEMRDRPRFAEPDYAETAYGRRYVYVIDLADRPPGVVDAMKPEILRSVDQLSDAQRFTVIAIEANNAREMPPFGLKVPTPETEQALAVWLDELRSADGSEASQALRLAAHYAPQVAFLLTGDAREALTIVQARRLRTQEDVTNKVNVIQFMNESDPSHVERLAETFDGLHRIVSAEELQKSAEQ